MLELKYINYAALWFGGISCTIILLYKSKDILMYEHEIAKFSGIYLKYIYPFSTNDCA